MVKYLKRFKPAYHISLSISTFGGYFSRYTLFPFCFLVLLLDNRLLGLDLSDGFCNEVGKLPICWPSSPIYLFLWLGMLPFFLRFLSLQISIEYL